MVKKILPFELGKILLLLWELAALITIGYGAYWLIWYLIQLLISPLPTDFILELASVLPESLQKISELIYQFFLGTSFDDAKAACIHAAVILLVGIVSLLLARRLLTVVECAFKKRLMPAVLRPNFSDVRYDPKKRRSIDEPLCQIGLLNYIERYYTANRLEGIYRNCWVAAEEIVCGGVYLNNYTSHRVKVRGQWLTIRLNRDFAGCVIIESLGSKNRFTHQAIAKRMCEIEFDYPAFAERFRCYSDSEEDVHALINREMADKLLHILEEYPDLCVVFEDGCVHFLVRRRSFNRHWEYVIPFCIPHLQRVANRLYGPLMDITDELLL